MYKETFFVSHDGYWNARDLDGRISMKIIIVYFTLVTSSTTSDRYEDNKTKARFLLRIFLPCRIHLIPKWRLSQMIWVELHENEASRAKRRCLQNSFIGRDTLSCLRIAVLQSVKRRFTSKTGYRFLSTHLLDKESYFWSRSSLFEEI